MVPDETFTKIKQETNKLRTKSMTQTVEKAQERSITTTCL